jgi:hypothetical protein
MRIAFACMFCLLTITTTAQKKNTGATLSTVQRAAMYSFLFQPFGSGRNSYLLPNHYTGGSLIFSFAQKDFTKSVWENKLPYMFAVIYRNIIPKDSLPYYDTHDVMIRVLDSIGYAGYTNLPGSEPLSNEDRLLLIGYALPYLTSIDVFHGDKVSIRVQIFPDARIQFPSDSALRSAYAVMLSIAAFEVLGPDKKKYDDVTVSFREENGEISYEQTFKLSEIENYVRDFDSFLMLKDKE